MSNATEAVPPLMARIEVTPDEWAEIRMLALAERVTTQKWIGQVLRERLAEKESG